MNCELSDKLVTVCMQFLNGIPDKIVNPVSGEEIEGVDFSYLATGSGKKK